MKLNWVWVTCLRSTRTDLKDFGIDRLLFFVEKADHLNGQVGRETAQFGLIGRQGRIKYVKENAVYIAHF